MAVIVKHTELKLTLTVANSADDDDLKAVKNSLEAEEKEQCYPGLKEIANELIDQSAITLSTADGKQPEVNAFKVEIQKERV